MRVESLAAGGWRETRREISMTPSVSTPDRYNASEMLDRTLAAGRGREVAIRCGSESLTYVELHERVCRFGSALKGLGLRREERLLLVLNDTPVFPVAFLGAIRAGCVPVPVNPFLKAEDYGFFLRDTYARAAVVDREHVEKVLAATDVRAEHFHVVVANGSSGDLRSFDDVVRGGVEAMPPAETHRDDMAFWLYSSGSTGHPKGVVHLQHDILYTCETYARHTLAIHPEDVTFSTSKLFHAYGLGNSLSFPCWAGATSVLLPSRPTPGTVLATVDRVRPTIFFSVPTLYNAILNDPDLRKYDLSSIRLCISAAEALPPEIWRRWKEATGLAILDGIGTTEMLHIFLSNRPNAIRPGSSGTPVPGYDAKVVDDEGDPVRPGQAGHLLVRGDSAAAYYWHEHAKTKTTILGEWVRTGDWYRVDSAGFYWYEGRTDDMMKVGGMWVSPIEMENALVEHPAVAEAAVVGVTVTGLNRAKAFIVLRAGHVGSEGLAGELRRWCKERLERYEYPHLVEFVADLPKTMTGKIQRFKLRGARNA
ncbi:MAG: benzoate-CoA ligase family protein [Methanobacteriota archaeon]